MSSVVYYWVKIQVTEQHVWDGLIDIKYIYLFTV